MKTGFIFAVCFVIIFAIGASIGFTHTPENIDNPQWHLPEGAIARLGKGTVNGLTYSPDGAQLVVASSIGIWVYDAQTLAPLSLSTGHTDIVSSVAYSPNGRTFASGSWDNTVRLWNAGTGQSKTVLSGHGDRIVSVGYSPDGRTFVSGSWDNTVRLWDTHTGQLKTILSGHTHRVNNVAFSPQGNMVASSAVEEDTVRLWDVATGETVSVLTVSTKGLTALAYSPDGTVLAVGEQGGGVQLWDVSAGEALATFTGHTKPVTSLAYSPDGSMLVSGSEGGTIRLWDVTSGRSVATLTKHSGNVHSVAYSPDGGTLVSGSDDGAIYFWDVATREIGAMLSGHAAPGDSVTYSPDGNIIAAGSENGTLRLWDVETRQPVATLIGHTARIRGVAFSPDGSRLGSVGGLDRTARLWDVATGEPISVLTGHVGGVLYIAFSPDGKTLATAGGYRDNTIRLWDVASGETTAVLIGHTSWVRSIAFSPDGKTLASVGGFGDNSVRLWDVGSGQTKAILTGHTSWVHTVAYSPDGSTIASAGNDTTVRLWDVASGQMKAILTGHTYEVFSVAFSPDGSMLASAGPRTVRLWHPTTGHAIATLTGTVYGTRSVAFSPDSSTLASTGADGTVFLWDLSLLLSEVKEIQTAVSQIQQQDSEGPRVRLAYFYPKDQVPRSGIVAQVDRIMKDVQVFYAREMKRHGYDIKTFRFEADPSGHALVHHIEGEFEQVYYEDNPYGKVFTEIHEYFDRPQDIFMVFLEVSGEFFGRDICGLGGIHGGGGGTAMFPALGNCFSFRIVAHELGHALGLYHDHREPNLMSGSTGYLSRLTRCTAHFLAVHPIFNFEQVSSNTLPKIHRLSPIGSLSTSIRIRFSVTHEEELHQVQLFAEALPIDPLPGTKLLACQDLKGKTAAFAFPITELTATPAEPISLQLTDIHGRTSWTWFPNPLDGTVQLDLNGDGVLDFSDLAVIGTNFGSTSEFNKADVNGDGTVNILDIVLVTSFLEALASGN